jgi:uncharacterized membrane protein
MPAKQTRARHRGNQRQCLLVATRLARLVVVGYEGVLILLGVAYVVLAHERTPGLVLIGVWDVLALGYVAIGVVVVKRAGDAAAEGFWFSMVFTVTASLIGMTAAGQAILNGPVDTVENVLGVTAMLLSWLLFHAGWARLYHVRGAGGLEFPAQQRPGRIEFLYFAFTIAVSFAVSDVAITRRDLRWQVTIHSVASFFYNAAVIALAIGTITG